MFDAHYDLLTIAYVSYLKNDYSYLNNICKAYHESNIKGVIANLYFMSLEEMQNELHPNYFKNDVSIIKMFQISTEIVKKFLPDTKILFSIEGCDYLEISDLEKLYDLGLRNILPTWNNKNKYASGNRSNDGLTEQGKKLLNKAIELGISIDLSHTNRNSYFDIINYLEKQKSLGKEFLVMASHSNCFSICNRDRNLTDDQILAIKKLNGCIGIMTNCNFIVPYELKNLVSQRDKEKYFLEHIKHLISLIGVTSICISTDDMDFLKEIDHEYGEISMFKYNLIGKKVKELLNQILSDNEVYLIMYGNMKKRYDLLKNNNIKIK